MEQKQLDEMENSFTGEEFLDEADLTDDVVIEEVKPKPKKNFKSVRKAVPEKKDTLKEAHSFAEEKKSGWEKEHHFNEPKAPTTPARPPIDPWKDHSEPAREGALGKVSTWKSITGIVVILLLLSLFTQGFSFSGKNEAGETVPIAEAEARVLNFVNTNLLQPPVTASVTESLDTGNLYKVTLSVAGLNIDSYITKDGQLFFPQGFDPGRSLQEQLRQETELEQPAAEEEYIEEITIDGQTGETTVKQVPLNEEEADGEQPAAGEEVVSEMTEAAITEPAPEAEAPTSFTITAKRWLFTPNRITVPVGKKITFTIEPRDLDFTFSMPDFGVEKDVKGTTMVEFTPTTTGTYIFSCSSCEEWRGMTGTLVAE